MSIPKYGMLGQPHILKFIRDKKKMTATTDTPRTDAWECFSDSNYYDMARLRRTDGPKDFNTGYHFNNLREAIEVRDTLNDLERRAEKAEAELERIYAGMQGSCYCCEPVGEINQKLEAEVERLKENMEIAEENLASLRMSLAQAEKRAIHFQHYCKKAQDMYNYSLVAFAAPSPDKK